MATVLIVALAGSATSAGAQSTLPGLGRGIPPTAPARLTQGVAVPASAVQVGAADALEITSADRITIKVQGQKDLSGDYRINEDQTISIPVLGRVSVAHLDAAGLEKAVAERISRLTGREAYVTVEVASYRPVFVSGYVNRPGAEPWTPGMTVLQAVTVSGGAFREGSVGAGGIDTKAQRAIDDQKRVLATIARLTAEQNDADKMDIPPRLIALVGRTEAQELIDAQQSSFLSRKAATEAQVDGLKRASDLAKEELETLKTQRDRLGDQLVFRKQQFAKLKALYEKQFLRADRLSEEQIRMADLEEKIASLGVSAMRTNSSLVSLEREMANFRQDRRALIDTDLLKLERDSAQLELEIEAAGPQPRKLTRPLSDIDPTAPKTETLVFEIVRQDGAVPKTIPADRNALLKPGDMLVVSVQ